LGVGLLAGKAFNLYSHAVLVLSFCVGLALLLVRFVLGKICGKVDKFDSLNSGLLGFWGGHDDAVL
jgi:hypothetical protein